ncbi:hypothetical protein BH10PLA2_BH10PLA2_00070 [soil metagenome]
MFETDVTDFEIATYGGSLFVVSFEGRPYVITAKHNLHDFNWRQLVILDSRFGRNVAGLDGAFFITSPENDAEGSDVADIVIITLAESVDLSFFRPAPFDLSLGSAAVAWPGDELAIYAALSQVSYISDKQISAQFAELGFQDTGPHSHDPVLRSAIAKWEGTEFSAVEGMSGAPVYNMTRDGISGMVVRGVMHDDGMAHAHYIDIQDIFRLIVRVHHGVEYDRYIKLVPRAGE